MKTHRIYNPVTGTYYRVRRRREGTTSVIGKYEGLWKPPTKEEQKCQK